MGTTVHPALERSKILIKNTHVSYLNFQKLHRVSFKKPKELKKSVGPKNFYSPLKIGYFLGIWQFVLKKGGKKYGLPERATSYFWISFQVDPIPISFDAIGSKDWKNGPFDEIAAEFGFQREKIGVF